MTSKQELENMILQFKVSDLQLLLGFAGQNKNGRKQELQKRALNLINYKMSIPLEMKIRHIYREMILENNSKPTSEYYYQNYNKYDNYHVNNSYSNQAASSIGCGSYNYYSNNNLDYYNNCVKYAKNNIFPPGCESPENFPEPQSSKFDYMNYLKPCTKIPDDQKLNNILMKKLSFFKYKSDIVLLTPLIPKTKRTDLFEYTLTFSLNPQQQSLICWSKKNDKEYRYQIQLRMCLLDIEPDLDNRITVVNDSLPLALGVKMNDKTCQLPPAIPSTNKQGMLLKRMNAPINLTPQTSRKINVNTLVINWSVECDKLYGVTIHLVEKFTSEELINKLKEKGERDPEITKKYLSDKFEELADDDIATTSLKVSLICPLGKILMCLPVRASTCNHLQCFDGSLYIKMNEVKSVWQCPVCNQNCYYEDLFIDGFFMNILRNENFSYNVTEIQINADGSVEPVIAKKRSNASPEESAPRKKNKINIEECSKNVPVVEEKKNEQISLSFIPLFSALDSYNENTKKADVSATNDDIKIDSENTDEPKRNVVLVDLTESDSESEESSSDTGPLDLKTVKNDNFISLGESYKNSLPPIFDIDD
ncbi:hypothetical protein PGB90_000429 [Kerria lacca]